jgi:hypothetical protein
MRAWEALQSVVGNASSIDSQRRCERTEQSRNDKDWTCFLSATGVRESLPNQTRSRLKNRERSADVKPRRRLSAVRNFRRSCRHFVLMIDESLWLWATYRIRIGWSRNKALENMRNLVNCDVSGTLPYGLFPFLGVDSRMGRRPPRRKLDQSLREGTEVTMALERAEGTIVGCRITLVIEFRAHELGQQVSERIPTQMCDITTRANVSVTPSLGPSRENRIALMSGYFAAIPGQITEHLSNNRSFANRHPCRNS